MSSGSFNFYTIIFNIYAVNKPVSACYSSWIHFKIYCIHIALFFYKGNEFNPDTFAWPSKISVGVRLKVGLPLCWSALASKGFTSSETLTKWSYSDSKTASSFSVSITSTGSVTVLRLSVRLSSRRRLRDRWLHQTGWWHPDTLRYGASRTS